MKSFAGGQIIAASLALTCAALGQQEPVLLVKLADFKNETEYQVVSVTEFKTLEKELQAEAKVFRQALEAAGRDWRNDPKYKDIPFPAAKLKPRKIIGLPERFAKAEEAEKRLDFYRDAEVRKGERERKRVQELQKKDDKAYKTLLEKQKEQDEKDALLGEAIKFLQPKLDELLGRTPPAAPGGPAPQPGKEHTKQALDKAL